MMSLKVSSFSVSSTSVGDGDFRNFISLLNRIATMFLKFSVSYSTFLWTIAVITAMCKLIDQK